jgi:release factor glutamine methyltransferase
MDGMTIHQAILHGEDLLSENGVEQPRWNAERLLIFALKQPRSKIYADLNRELSTSELQTFEELLSKRAKHYPLSYIEGTQEFFGRSFTVTEDVLIPRPETEEVVQIVLSVPLPEKPAILDLGAGSGNIAVTLALEVPFSFVVALEISKPAMTVLRKNSRGRIHPVIASFVSPPFLPDSFDVVTANLPYVEAPDFAKLSPETGWEPRIALFTESLESTYKSVIQKASELLRQGGYLVFEIGFGQADRIQNVCTQNKALELLTIRKDQNSIPRVFVLRKKS